MPTPLYVEVAENLLSCLGGGVQAFKDEFLRQHGLPLDTSIDSLGHGLKIELAMRARSLAGDIEAHVKAGLPRVAQLILAPPAGGDQAAPPAG